MTGDKKMGAHNQPTPMWKVALWCIFHPLHTLGGLLFFAGLEGMFGSPAGAQRMLTGACIVLCFAIIAGIALAMYALVTAFGPVMMLVVGVLGMLWLAIYCMRHVRWEA